MSAILIKSTRVKRCGGVPVLDTGGESSILSTLTMKLEEFFKKEKEFKMYHPVKYFLRELYYECTYRTWRRITDVKDEIKWGFQRMFRGYDDTAYWGLYSYVTDITLPVLKYYKEHKVGIPGMVCEEGEDWKVSEKRWDDILDRMIYAFQVIKNDEHVFNPPEIEVKVKEGLELFAKYFQTLWD